MSEVTTEVIAQTELMELQARISKGLYKDFAELCQELGGAE